MLKTAALHGLPMSVFLGRRKPGSIWLSDDTIAALAWQSYVDSLCPGCGHPRHESMDKEHRGEYAVTTTRCFACQAVGERQAGMTKQLGSEPMPPGIYFSSERLR